MRKGKTSAGNQQKARIFKEPGKGYQVMSWQAVGIFRNIPWQEDAWGRKGRVASTERRTRGMCVLRLCEEAPTTKLGQKMPIRKEKKGR